MNEPAVAPSVSPAAAPLAAPPATPPLAAEIRREATPNGGPNGANGGEPRQKLHLSLGGNGHGATNGNGHVVAERPAQPQPNFGAREFAPPRPQQPQGAGERNGQRPFQPPRNPPPFDGGGNDRDFAAPEPRSAMQQPRDSEAPRKDNGAYIDQELRTRVDGDIAAFLAAFDAALAEDSQASRFGLREATDRLLRAGARTRIELERLEAKMPLPPRDGAAPAEQGAWRYR